jgi:hypothetical protein
VDRADLGRDLTMAHGERRQIEARPAVHAVVAAPDEAHGLELVGLPLDRTHGAAQLVGQPRVAWEDHEPRRWGPDVVRPEIADELDQQQPDRRGRVHVGRRFQQHVVGDRLHRPSADGRHGRGLLPVVMPRGYACGLYVLVVVDGYHA